MEQSDKQTGIAGDSESTITAWGIYSNVLSIA